MEKFYIGAYEFILEELDRGRPIKDSMSDLIDLCQTFIPHPDWFRFKSLDYDESTHMRDWITRPFREDPPSHPIRGLWFGLCNPCRNRVSTADIYVCGSDRFGLTEEDEDWAVSPFWRPEPSYACSNILAEIYRIAYQDGGLENEAEYPLCLGYGAFVVRELLRRIDPEPILGRSESIGVVVGFDSGDFVPLGDYGKAGWAARE